MLTSSIIVAPLTCRFKCDSLSSFGVSNFTDGPIPWCVGQRDRHAVVFVMMIDGLFSLSDESPFSPPAVPASNSCYLAGNSQLRERKKIEAILRKNLCCCCRRLSTPLEQCLKRVDSFHFNNNIEFNKKLNRFNSMPVCRGD